MLYLPPRKGDGDLRKAGEISLFGRHLRNKLPKFFLNFQSLKRFKRHFLLTK